MHVLPVTGVAPDTIVEESEGEELIPKKSHDPDKSVVIESGSESGNQAITPANNELITFFPFYTFSFSFSVDL